MAEGLRTLNPSKCWRYLFSRFVSKQVSSARVSLTSVFGMGTGGPSLQSTPTYFFLKEKVSKKNFKPRALVRLNQACQVSAVYSFATFLVSRNRFEDVSTPSKPNKVTAACLASACMSSRTILGQALGLLVPVSSIHYCTSTSGLSTSSSTTCLTP